jgi:hypothetical protein
MLGPQVGIVVKKQHNISYYRDLFEYYKERLESLMSIYNVGTPDFIIIHLKEIIVDDKLKIGRLSQIELPKRLINVSETKTKFNSNILPLTLDEKQFGSLLQESLRVEYLNTIINKLQINLPLLLLCCAVLCCAVLCCAPAHLGVQPSTAHCPMG